MRGDRELEALRVQAIANLNLPRNVAKCHWGNLSARRLLWLLVVEVWELAVALQVLRKARKVHVRVTVQFLRDEVSQGYFLEKRDARDRARDDVRHEVGDVACFAMMIADRCGALKY